MGVLSRQAAPGSAPMTEKEVAGKANALATAILGPPPKHGLALGFGYNAGQQKIFPGRRIAEWAAKQTPPMTPTKAREYLTKTLGYLIK